MRRHRIDRVVADLAPDPGPGLTAGALELLGELTTEPPGYTAAPRRSPWRRWRPLRFPAAVLLAAAATVAVMVAGWVVPGGFGVTPGHADTLDIRRQGAFYVITVKDLFAAPERYEAQLRGLGLDIRLRVKPVPPAAEGSVFAWDMSMDGLSDREVELSGKHIFPIRQPGSCSQAWRCPIGLKVPVGFTGSAIVRLGRKARPGERYAVLRPLQSPGEPLHCVPFIGGSVDLVRGLLLTRGVTVDRYFDGVGFRSSVPGTWFVQEGYMSEPGKATLFATPDAERPEVPGPDMAGDPCPAAPS